MRSSPVRSTWLLVILAAASLSARAQQCPDIAPYQKARDTIADLGRVVAPTGIQESYKTKVGGIDQWINVRGQDKANPIILFVHGGPASPFTPTAWEFQRPIEEYFTVAHYDQRGAGKSYNNTDDDTIGATVNVAQYVNDAIEVAEHLRAKYGKRKVILVGHSWGTIVASSVLL